MHRGGPPGVTRRRDKASRGSEASIARSGLCYPKLVSNADPPRRFSLPRPFSITREPASALAEDDLPPVVARMVVEIRSDGSRTVARGAIEDLQSGERVALRADASTPVALAGELAKSLLRTPALAREAVKAALPSILRRRR